MSNTKSAISSDESLTHPQAYRDAINGKIATTIKDSDQFPCKSASACSSDKDWDMYPQLIRTIENQGSEKQVNQLHEIEKKCQS